MSESHSNQEAFSFHGDFEEFVTNVGKLCQDYENRLQEEKSQWLKEAYLKALDAQIADPKNKSIIADLKNAKVTITNSSHAPEVSYDQYNQNLIKMVGFDIHIPPPVIREKEIEIDKKITAISRVWEPLKKYSAEKKQHLQQSDLNDFYSALTTQSEILSVRRSGAGKTFIDGINSLLEKVGLPPLKNITLGIKGAAVASKLFAEFNSNTRPENKDAPSLTDGKTKPSIK